MPLSTVRDEGYREKKKAEIKAKRVPGGHCKWVLEEGVMASEKSPGWGEGCPTEKASGRPWGCAGCGRLWEQLRGQCAKALEPLDTAQFPAEHRAQGRREPGS